MSTAAAFPVDSRHVWPSGQYMVVDGGWYQFETVYRGTSEMIRLYSADTLPGGFAPLAEPTTRLQRERYSGFRDISIPQAGPVVAVDTYCVWKGATWSVIGIPDPAVPTVRLSLCAAVPADYGNITSEVTDLFLSVWPGMEIGWGPNQVQTRARYDELTLVRMDVTPVDRATGQWDTAGRAVWWRASLCQSPFLSPEAAMQAVLDHVERHQIDKGDYPFDKLSVARLRDGWRVWGDPPPVDDPRDLRLGWAVFYVADDAVVTRSSTSQPLLDASAGLTNDLYRRLRATRRIAASGPGGPELAPTVIEPPTGPNSRAT